MLKKFVRNLILRSLIVAFAGDQTASVFEDPVETVERSAAATAMQALDELGAGWRMALLPVTAYQVMRGSGP